MRLVIQRVKKSKVRVDKEIVGQIGKGLLILLAIHSDDKEELITKAVNKIIKLRIFEDEGQKMNLSLRDVSGEVMLVSQFTLYGDCKKGNRPSFIKSAKSEKAEIFYDKFIKLLRQQDIKVATGRFGTFMELESINSGPTTIILDI